MLLDVNILSGRHLEYVGLKRAQELAGDVLALDAVRHVPFFAGIHQVRANGEPRLLADWHMPDAWRHLDVEQATERFDEHDRAAARFDSTLEQIVVADEFGDKFRLRILGYFARRANLLNDGVAHHDDLV